MPNNYANLGLNNQLQANSSLINQEPNFIDAISDITRRGGLSYYTQKSPGRSIKAVVAKNPAAGAFNDVQAAINHVNNLGGGVVLFTTGTYAVGSNLQMYSNVFLQGEDADTAVIDFGSANIGILCVGTTNGTLSNIEISNLGITNSWAVGPNGAAVQVDYCNDISIASCRFQANGISNGTTYADIRAIGNSSRIYIQNNRFIQSSTTLFAGSVTDVFFTDNFIGSSWGYLINDKGTVTRTIIRNNIIVAAGTDADALIFLEGPGPRLTIEGNQFILPRVPSIIVGQSTGVLINNNIIDGNSNSGDGITVRDSSILCTITGNTILRCTAGTTSDGISIQASNFNIISGNAIGSNSGYGINIGTGGTTNVVTGNVFKSNTVGSINDLGTTTVISGNGGA